MAAGGGWVRGEGGGAKAPPTSFNGYQSSSQSECVLQDGLFVHPEDKVRGLNSLLLNNDSHNMNLLNNITAGGVSASGYGSVGSVNGSVNDSGNKLDIVLAHWDYGNPGRVVKKRPPANRNVGSSRSSGRDRSKNGIHGHRFVNSKIPYHKKADAVDELAWSFGQSDMMMDREAGGQHPEGGIGSSVTLHPHHHFLHPLEERSNEKGGPASIQTHCMPSPASVNPVTPLSVSNAMTPKQNGPGSVPPSSIASQPARTPGDPASIRSPYPHPLSNGPLTPAMDMEGKLGPTTPKSVGGPPSCGPAAPPLGSPFGPRNKNIATMSMGTVPNSITGNGERKPDISTIKQEPANVYQQLSQSSTTGATSGPSSFTNNTQSASSQHIGTAQMTTNVFNSFFKTESDNSANQDVKLGQLNLQSTCKRPALPFKEYEAELHRAQITLSDSIYNSASMQDWLNHPVKKYRRTEKGNQKMGIVAEPPKRPLYRRKSQTDLLKLSFAANGTDSNAVLSGIKTEQEMQTSIGMSGGVVNCKREQESNAMDCGVGFTLGSNSDDPFDFDPKGANKVSDDDLYTEAGIKPSMNDLDNLFESDDSDGNGVGPTPPTSVPEAGTGSLGQEDTTVPDNIGISYTKVKNLPSISQQNNPSGNKIDPTGNLPHDQLSKMFPTPPSHEHNPIASPGDGEISDPTALHSMGGNIGQPTSPITDQIFMDVNFGGSVEDAMLMLSSTKFAAIDLQLRQYPFDLKYKVSNQLLNGLNISQLEGYHTDQMGHLQTHNMSHNVNPHYGGGQLTSSNVAGNLKIGLSPMSPLPPSPRVGGPRSHHSGTTSHMAVDHGQNLSSPAPNPSVLSTSKVASGPSSSHSMKCSSKTINTNELTAPEIEMKRPEANSLAINLVLSDSLLNVFRDHNFDSCTMCVCSNDGNIRGRDAAKYLPPWTDCGSANGDTNDCPNCQCGFSAVINRKLSYHSGLFYEDETEITNINEDLYQRKKHSLLLVNGDADDAVTMADEGESTEFSAKSAEVDAIPSSLLDIIHQQYSLHNLSLAQNALLKCSDQYLRQLASLHPPTLSMVEMMDNNYVISSALEQFTKSIGEDSHVRMNKQVLSPKDNCVHKWTLLHAPGPYCSEDIMRVMKALQPILNSSLHVRKPLEKNKVGSHPKGPKGSHSKSQTDLSSTQSVAGPLTWRQFHQKAGPATKGNTDDSPSPLPIPAVTVGHEKDFITLSPLALHFWESLSLEPFSQPRDVAYIVVAPDNDFLNNKVKSFFKNLSSTYELCRLGRHVPITNVLRDGILKVGKKKAEKLANTETDRWFELIGDSATATLIKLYSQVCRHYLAPLLHSLSVDRTLIDTSSVNQRQSPSVGNSSSADKPPQSPMPPPSTGLGGGLSNNHDNSNGGNNSMHLGDKVNLTDSAANESFAASENLNGPQSTTEDSDGGTPAVVIYMIDPFSFGAETSDVMRLSSLGLLRCFSQMLPVLNDMLKNNIYLQVVSLEGVLEATQSKHQSQMPSVLRGLAFSVYSQVQRSLQFTRDCKTLTGFGPGSSTEKYLKMEGNDKAKIVRQLNCPAYVLALPPIKKRTSADNSADSEKGCTSSVLFCNYFLSEDQHWLFASCCDDRGELVKTVVINIEIPNKTRRKKASARRVGLRKLMDWILGIMTMSLVSWRLVIGRVGRIGHGELRGWSVLLGKKELKAASKQLREMCCWQSDVPSILSACLISLEPDSNLRIFTDQYTPDERFGQTASNCQLSTPKDASCTHILVFPTSAKAQSSQNTFEDNPAGLDQNGLGLDFDLDLAELEGNDGADGGLGDLGDLFDVSDDMFGIGEGVSSGADASDDRGHKDGDGINTGIVPTNGSQPGTPSIRGHGGHGPGGTQNDGRSVCNDATFRYGQEEAGARIEMAQQPLALGYLVSTAPTGSMPRWFWSSCPHLEHVCPVFLKAALHVKVASGAEDGFTHQSASGKQHSLDSTYTSDVLR